MVAVRMHRVETEVLPSLSESAYPDPESFPADELHRLTELPDGKRMGLEWFKENIWEEAEDFELPPDKVLRGRQAVIFSLVLTNEDGSEERRLIGKRVVPRELPPKSSAQMWRDFADSAAREIQFYRRLAEPGNEPIRRLLPVCHYSDQSEIRGSSDIVSSGFFFLLMDDVSDRFYQKASLSSPQARALMSALAEFHAHFWTESPCDVTEEERGGFWTMTRRKALREVESASSTWMDLLERLPELKHLVPDCGGLAGKLAVQAANLDCFVRRHSGLTQIHGDCKAWNVFLSRSTCQEGPEEEEEEQQMLFIDMQWTGKGHPLQDVAYALTTSLEPGLLSDMDDFVDLYLRELFSRLSEMEKTSPLDREELRSHFDLVWLDYARVVVSGLWKGLSHEQIERYRDVVGPSMINKSMDHVEFIVRRLHQKLVDEDVCKRLRQQ